MVFFLQRNMNNGIRIIAMVVRYFSSYLNKEVQNCKWNYNHSEEWSTCYNYNHCR